MFRAVLYLLSLMCRGSLFQIKLNVEWDDKVQAEAKNVEFKCGIENKYKNLAQARIVNGRETSNIKYPWMVEIVRVNRPIKIEEAGEKRSFKGFSRCGGSIISHKSILTAGHCVCIDHANQKWVATCLADEIQGAAKTPINQNHQENFVHYTFGSMEAAKPFEQLQFNKDVRSYLYQYEPEWWTKSPEDEEKQRRIIWKNGDAAVIINKSRVGLNLEPFNAIPICLPTPHTFEEVDFQVTLVGRGKIYEECPPTTRQSLLKKPSTLSTSTTSSTSQYSTSHYSTNPATAYPNSCMTNGERIYNNMPHNTKFKFSSCRNYVRKNGEGNCFGFENAEIIRKRGKGSKKSFGYNKKLISTELKIRFFGKIGAPNRRIKIELPENDKCEDISGDVMRLLDDEANKLESSRDDLKVPSRIVVLEKRIPIKILILFI